MLQDAQMNKSQGNLSKSLFVLWLIVLVRASESCMSRTQTVLQISPKHSQR